jgi:uncharacterized protein YjbI with pentapeptide repeats
VPWRDELTFVLRKYEPADEATGEEALAALARLVLDDWARQPREPRWRLRVPDDAKGLDKRWQDAAGRERADRVVGALLGNGDLRSAAFGEHDGRLDLRGFVDPGHQPHGREAISLASLDLSGARIGPLMFTRRSITNCRFDGATFEDLRLWSSSISDSSFRGAKFMDAPGLDARTSFGLGARCHHRKTDFSGADLSGLHVDDAILEDCDFSGARLDRALFSCDLLRCRFAGHLHDVSFRGRGPLVLRVPRFQAVDLTEADLHYVGFNGVDLDDFRLPDDPRLRVVARWPCVLRFLTERYPSSPEETPMAVRLAMTEARYLPRHGKIVLELTTIEEHAGKGGTAELERLLDEAEASCVR